MFAKVYTQIFDSSIAEDHQVRHAFMDLLVLADQEGVVDMTLEAIARRTNVPIEQVSRCITILSQPDARSRSSEESGARIKLIDSHRDWGWQIINYGHYRELRDEESRRAYFRDYKRRQRQKAKSESNLSTPVHTRTAMSTQAEAEAEADKGLAKSPSASSPPSSNHGAFIAGWCQNFKAKFGFDYAFSGGQDAKAVKELLKMGILLVDLLEIAKEAWNRMGQSPRAFYCEQASTISAFRKNLNQIRTELKYGTHQPNSRKGVDRNAGTLNAGKSGQYAGVGRVDGIQPEGTSGHVPTT